MNTTTTTKTMTRNQMARRNRRNLKWIALGLVTLLGIYICWDGISYLIHYNWSPIPQDNNRDIMAYEVDNALIKQEGLYNLFVLPPVLIVCLNAYALVSRIWAYRSKETVSSQEEFSFEGN